MLVEGLSSNALGQWTLSPVLQVLQSSFAHVLPPSCLLLLFYGPKQQRLSDTAYAEKQESKSSGAAENKAALAPYLSLADDLCKKNKQQ